MKGGRREKGSDPSGLRGRLVGAVVGLTAFLIYVLTLAPTVLPYGYPEARDVGILQIKAALLAVPDVTGYPLWVMLTHLFTYLPFGDAAYRANLASAAYAAVAVFFLYLVCLRLTRRAAPSAAGALLFAFSQTFWSQAVVAEVYTLNALFIAATLFVLLLWRDARRDRHLLFAALLMGLSLTHHLTSGLLLPAALLFVFTVDRRKLLEWPLVLKGAGLFLAGLLPYLYLPIRASMDPPFSGADPTSLRGFYELVSGAGYKSAMFAFGPSELPGRAAYYFEDLAVQFHPALLALALVGVVGMLLRDRAGLALLGFLYAGWLFYALEYDIGDVYMYFIPTHLILCAAIAQGLAVLLHGSERILESSSAPAARALPAVASALMLVAPLASLAGTYGSVDRSGDDEGRRIIEAVASEAAPGAVVLQHRSPLLYMQHVEGRRRDLTIASSPYRRLDGSFKNLDAPERYLKEEKPLYVLFPREEAVSRWERDGYELVPVEEDMLYEIVEG